TAPMIDDLEVAADAEAPDNAVIPHDNRVGYWYVYASTAAGAPTEIVLDPPNGTEMVLPSDADAYAGTYSMIVTGSDVVNAVDDAGATTYGSAGVGLTFNDNCPFDASAYTGISFWAKGDATV